MNNSTKTSDLLNAITFQQAIEWRASDEKFSFVCDEFGLFATQDSLIEAIERKCEKLCEEYYSKNNRYLRALKSGDTALADAILLS